MLFMKEHGRPRIGRGSKRNNYLTAVNKVRVEGGFGSCAVRSRGSKRRGPAEPYEYGFQEPKVLIVVGELYYIRFDS